MKNLARQCGLALAIACLTGAAIAQEDAASNDLLGLNIDQILSQELGDEIDGPLTLRALTNLPTGAQRELNDITVETQEIVDLAPAAALRALDRLSGRVQDLTLDRGQTVAFGGIEIAMGDCRYPRDNPAGDAYAFLVVREEGQAEPVFDGWMVASSPALNAMDHPRYDAWVLSCLGQPQEATEEAAAQ